MTYQPATRSHPPGPTKPCVVPFRNQEAYYNKTVLLTFLAEIRTLMVFFPTWTLAMR